MIVGLLALFVALGGTSYAVIVLPQNSVGTRQIRPGGVKSPDIAGSAVTSRKVKDGSLLLKDFKPGLLVKGTKGDQGPKGDAGAPGPQGPPASVAQSDNLARVDCDNTDAGALQRAIDRAQSGDTIHVLGTCRENLTVPVGKDLLKIDGGGTGTIAAADNAVNTILVRGSGNTFTGLTVTGGRTGFDVGRASNTVIDGNTIQGAARFGITVGGFGIANIVNNTIQNNASNGILVTGSSFAFIGFSAADDTVASPNIIRNNGLNGISIQYSSSARVVGNVIIGNARNGVSIDRGSQANVSSNAIDGNRQSGVFITENSGANLGSDAGTGIFDAPNTTSTQNTLSGVTCRVGGYSNGRLGTLNGTAGPKDFGTSCVDSLDRPDTF